MAKGRIFDLPLYQYLDAGESVTRAYSLFLLRTPSGFEGDALALRADKGMVFLQRSREGDGAVDDGGPHAADFWGE